MSKATDRIKEMRKQNNMKNNNMKKEDRITKLREEQERLNLRYDNPTYEEIKAIINKHLENGTVYATRTHDEAFKYLNDMRYTVDIIANYSCAAHNKYDKSITTMCITNVYIVVRETGEVILVDHTWLDETLAHIPVGIYTAMYKSTKGGEVFINRLKTMKYANNYKNNGRYKIRYQLSSECKTKRAEYVQRIHKAEGITMSINDIRAML